jgi:hypothetical protein
VRVEDRVVAERADGRQLVGAGRRRLVGGCERADAVGVGDVVVTERRSDGIARRADPSGDRQDERRRQRHGVHGAALA